MEKDIELIVSYEKDGRGTFTFFSEKGIKFNNCGVLLFKDIIIARTYIGNYHDIKYEKNKIYCTLESSFGNEYNVIIPKELIEDILLLY